MNRVLLFGQEIEYLLLRFNPLLFTNLFCLWLQEDYRNFMPGCPWEEDLKYARAVCDEVGAIPFIYFSC